MPNIREKRLHDLRTKLGRLTERREQTITTLVKLDTQVKVLKLKVVRYEKAAAQPPKPKAEPKPQPEWPALEREKARVQAAAAAAKSPPPQPPSPETTDEDVPGFLRRTPAPTSDKDAEAAEAIRKEQEEARLAKSRGRIAKLKADKSGERKRMPLTGKAALEAIRG